MLMLHHYTNLFRDIGMGAYARAWIYNEGQIKCVASFWGSKTFSKLRKVTE